MLSPSDNVEISVNPNKANQKYSVGPNINETLASGGAKRARHITPIIPPTNEDIQLIDIARSPSPFFANGYPSNVVATAEGVPGVLIKIADHDPPKIAPVYIAPRTISPEDGSSANVKGTRIATAIVAESPGKAPIMIPARTPENAKPKLIRLSDDKKSAKRLAI
jgi:hypothetical protein